MMTWGLIGREIMSSSRDFPPDGGSTVRSCARRDEMERRDDDVPRNNDKNYISLRNDLITMGGDFWEPLDMEMFVKFTN